MPVNNDRAVGGIRTKQKCSASPSPAPPNAEILADFRKVKNQIGACIRAVDDLKPLDDKDRGFERKIGRRLGQAIDELSAWSRVLLEGK